MNIKKFNIFIWSEIDNFMSLTRIEKMIENHDGKGKHLRP